MGVFSELDLENQQTELDGHDSKAAEIQSLQAKLIQQHEQKKAAAAAETPGKEPAAEPVAKTEAEQEDPAAAEAERRRQHEETEAKRKAEWERQQGEKRAAETAALAKIEQMSETELVKASMERMKKETERLTRRNLKECVSEYHPTVNFLYYALVLLFSMCLMHPAYLAISLTGALAYDIYLKGRKAVRFAVMGLLPMAVLAALVNPAFNHEGATILTYLPSGNPLTLESMLYGIAAAVMLASVVLWFSSYNEVMTSDKFVYLFGRVIPALSLVLSMALRFIPKFKAQMQTVSEAQACIGRDTKNGSVFRRVGNAVKIFSIMVTWSLENAIETADSMRSRGYGLPGRTAFSIYRFDDRDKSALAWLIFCGAYLISGWMAGGTYFRYYPTIKAAAFTPMTVSFMLVYLALVLTPVILDRREDRLWNSLQSNI